MSKEVVAPSEKQQRVPTLFYNDTNQSREALRLFKEREKGHSENCRSYNVSTLNIPPGDEFPVLPYLYTPEGEFPGLQKIKFFLNIPEESLRT